jgi:hypothetical protein
VQGAEDPPVDGVEAGGIHARKLLPRKG